MDVFGQSPFDCRLHWGPEGVRLAAHGGSVFPVVAIPEAREAAAKWGATELLGRSRPSPEGWSHSPVSLTKLTAGLRFVYFSANGSRCCKEAQGATALLLGSLVNASAAGRAAARLQGQTGPPISVVACGERWEGETLRPSLEEELGAGAILAALPGTKSPEARAAVTLFQAVGDRLDDLVFDSASGRELRVRGFGGDMAFAQRLDVYDTVPLASPCGLAGGSEAGEGVILPAVRLSPRYLPGMTQHRAADWYAHSVPASRSFPFCPHSTTNGPHAMKQYTIRRPLLFAWGINLFLFALSPPLKLMMTNPAAGLSVEASILIGQGLLGVIPLILIHRMAW